MTIKSSISNNLNRALAAWLAVAVLVFATAPAFGHGGFEHVIGSVVKVTNDVLTIKTTTGNVEVKLDSKTEFTKNDQKAQLTDLTPGARVVVNIPEGSKDKVAHSVKIGTAAKSAGHHAEDSHK